MIFLWTILCQYAKCLDIKIYTIFSVKTLERKKSELQKLHSQVESQEIQLIDKEQLDGERILIQRDIQQCQESYKGFENSVFKEDLLLVSVRKKVTIL